jgi:hypothetical protein
MGKHFVVGLLGSILVLTPIVGLADSQSPRKDKETIKEKDKPKSRQKGF